MPPRPLTIHPVTGLPEFMPGDDLAAAFWGAVQAQGLALAEGDVVVVAQKAVSKCEGSRMALSAIDPSPFARYWAEKWGKDPRQVEIVLRESRRIVRMERGLIIAETRHGYVCANAGVDLSNAGTAEGVAILLPEDPDRSARTLRERIRDLSGRSVAVIVADTFGRPWRSGLVQVALGAAGLLPVRDYRGKTDADGRELKSTEIALADELASAADLVCGKVHRVPIAVIQGYEAPPGEADGRALIRPPEMDLFR
ncbi:MAG: coenzyme F420-0:L-glutamate ligase [Candidatus Lambdaproteobacteria bacterium]|nr:coenzyme F420-0:L-glutamate ligase [Candidatus Lambdaproteobacteria bacterium]